MASTVVILTPHGRRQTVKCTPNTTILQIIEEVCKKQGFKAEEYDVKHHNKILDTSSTFRFSGLPNNAQLELVPATRQRVDSDITLAVNLESGDRLIGNFVPDDNLKKVLTALCPEQLQNENLVIIYTRREIIDSDFEKTTLRSLGLTGGRAMIRLIQRSPETLKTQANISAPLPQKPQEEKPYRRKLQSDEPHSEPMSSQDSSEMELKPPAPSVQKKPEVDLIKLAREKRKLPLSPAKIDGETLSPKSKIKIDEEKISPPVNTTVEEKMDVDNEEVDEHLELLKAEHQRREEEDNTRLENIAFLGARNALLFSLETAKTVDVDDLPDDFFELTIDDARKILKDIRSKRHQMENGMLKTKAMRQLEETTRQLNTLAQFKKTIIRIQFSDQIVLQGTFKPSETVFDVIDFVREYIQKPDLKIYLYTTPPKTILTVSDTLLEVDCVPAALLHIGCYENEAIHLKPEVLDKITTNSLASLVASKTRKENTRIVPRVESDVDYSSNSSESQDLSKPGPSSMPTTYDKKKPSPQQSTTEKVPKWFKPTK